jgi:3-dehydroquinate dehydratase-2
MRILVLHGPNLNRLGKRELDAQLQTLAASLGVETQHLQSNHEGVLIDAIHAADDTSDGIVFNPGAFTHYSYAIRDALASIRRPCVEVHLSDIHTREPWRRVSVVADICVSQIVGRGVDSYLDGLRLIVDRLRSPA